MEFRGYKITFDTKNWQQINLIGDFWDFLAEFVPRHQLVGLGWNWDDDVNATTFDYALGVIDDPKTLSQLSQVDFSQAPFQPEPCIIPLPKDGWQTFSGHVDGLQQIYEQQIDPLGAKDYELEYIDDAGNLKIKIHFK